MAVKTRLYVLKGFKPNGSNRGPQEQLFTHNEKATAVAIAKRWHAKGWKPYLFSKTYDGDFKVWYDHKTAKLPVRKVAVRKAA
jgi:hypothetical protein